MKNKILLTAAAITLFGAGLFTSPTVFADDSASAQTEDNPMQMLVQKIAKKFNLQESEVKAVFEENRQERMAQRTAEYKAKLAELVQAGKITEAQKQLIEQKHSELQAKHAERKESMQTLTPEQRRTQMESERQELESWAKQNGIDLQYLMPQMGKGTGMRGPHHDFELE